MSQSAQTWILILITIAAFILANMLAARRMKKAANFIIEDLKEKKAFDPAAAVELPYSKSTAFRIGLKDYRTGALAQLVKYDVVRLTEDGRYYLRDSQQATLDP